MNLSVRVFDIEDQQVLPGAHLTFLNQDGTVNFSKEGTSTGLDGYADLTNVSIGDIVGVSFIGYETYIIECEDGILYDDNIDYQAFDIEMQRSTVMVGEAVVVARRNAKYKKHILPFAVAFFLLVLISFMYFRSRS